MGNPSKHFEFIRLYPKLTSDPLTGKVGEIYYNSMQETLRICINEIGPVWANVIVSFAGLGTGTVDNSAIRWDSGTSKWVENDQIYLDENSIHGKNITDFLSADSLTLQAANNAGSGDGGDLILNAGTSAGGNKGGLEINSSSILISGDSTIEVVNDSNADSNPAQDFTIQASSKTAGSGDGGDLILNAGTSAGGNKGKIIFNGYVLELQADAAVDPLTGSSGQLYYNTTVNAFRYYNGTQWIAFGDFLANGSVPMTGNLNLDLYKIINVADPDDSQDAATKNYVDIEITSLNDQINTLETNINGLIDIEISEREYQDNQLLPLDGSRSMTGDLDLDTHKITNLANGTNPTDAINLSQLTAISEVTNEPTGFEDRNHSELLFNDNGGVPIFTIQPKAPYTSFDFYVKGTKYTKSVAQTVTTVSHPSFPYTGNNYFYFDETGTLQVTNTFDPAIIKEYAFVAIAYWNPETNSHTYFAEERHGLTMDGETHSYLHTVFGARYLNGLALDTFNTSTGYFEIDQGSIRDEDILHTISRDATISILYRQGANALWRKKAGGAYPLIYPGSLPGYAGTTIPYNQNIGGTWQLTAVQNNKYVLMHYFATNDIENGIIGIQGIAEHDSVEAARTAANEEISSLSGLPFAEFVPIGTVVFQTSSGYASPTKGVIQLVDGANYVDFRGTQLYTPAGTATTHGLLSGLSSDDHAQYLLVNGNRAMSGNLDMGVHKITNVTDPTLAQDAATKNYVDNTIVSTVSDITYGISWNGITGIAPSKNAVYDELETLLKTDGTRALTGNLNLNSHKITNVTDPTLAQDAATKNYVDTEISAIDFSTVVLRDGSQAMTGNLNMGANTPPSVVNFLTPGSSYDGGATYGYDPGEVLGQGVSGITGSISKFTLYAYTDYFANVNFTANVYERGIDGLPTGPLLGQSDIYNTSLFPVGIASPIDFNFSTTVDITGLNIVIVISQSAANSFVFRRGGGASFDYGMYRSGLTLTLAAWKYDHSIEIAGSVILNKIINVLNPTSDQDAATKKYVDDTVAALGTGDFMADGSVAMTGNLNLNSHKITNVTDPTLAQDAATKNYVDSEITSAITGTTSYFAGFDPITGILTEVPGYVFYDDGSLEIGAQNSITIPSGIDDYISIGISPTVANPGLNNLSGVQLNSPINETVANYSGFQVFGYGTNKPDNFTAYRSNTNYDGIGTDITHFTAGGGSDCTGTVKAFEFNSAGNAGTIQGVALYPSGNATTIEGSVFQPSGTYTDATGIRVDLSYATITNRPVGLDISGGTLGSTATFNTVSNFPTLVDSCNIIRPIFEVQSGSEIINTDVLMTNLAGFMDFKDSHTGTGPLSLNLGVVSVSFVSQVAVDSAKIVDSISMNIAGLAVDSTSAGGTVTNAHLYRGSAFDFGGTLNIDNFYGLKIENTLSSKATNTWGIAVEDVGAENYLAKSLKIGGLNTVSDSTIGLEIDDAKTVKLPSFTTLEKTSLPNIAGTVVYDETLGTISTNNGTAWVNLGSGGGGGTGDFMADGSVAMTGNLDMALNVIENVSNLTSSGLIGIETIGAGGTITLSAQLSAITVSENILIASADQIQLNPTTNVSLSSKNIVDLADPTGPQDAATKNYVDSENLNFLRTDGSNAMTDALKLEANQIWYDSIGNTTSSFGLDGYYFLTDKGYRIEALTDINIITNGAINFAAPSGFDFNGQQIKNLGDPASAQDAATKKYVDDLIAGIPSSTSVDSAITGTLIDWSAGDTFYKLISTNTTFTFSNETNGKTISVFIKNTGASDVSIVLPTALKSGILNLVVTAGKENVYTFVRSNSKTYVTCISDFE